MPELFHSSLLVGMFWSLLTIGFYLVAKRIYRQHPGNWWASPLLLTPVILALTALLLHTHYSTYSRSTHWLIAMLAPATVSFAVPIYEQRNLIRQNWLLLLIGVVVGNLTAVISAWGLSTLFGLDKTLCLSLLPRSISTPFAIIVSGDIGGVPGLTAMFVIVTGVFGALIGDLLLRTIPFRSSLAKGALFGMGAHGAGTAKAHSIGDEVGAIAGLVMVFSGLASVLVTPIVLLLIR